MAKLIQYATKASFYDGPFGEDGVPWISAGMGYVIITDTGHLIVIDGGHDKDAEDFLSLLKDRAGGIPVVDTWIITHPHKDHYGVLYEISKRQDIRESIRINEVVYRFPEEFKDGEGNNIHPAIDIMDSVITSTGAIHTVPKEGDTVKVDNISVRFLFVPDDLSLTFGPNDLSLIFMIDTKEKRLLFTGDAGRQNLRYVADRYGSEIKCDVLQLPHHGLCDTGHGRFYDAADADTVLIPTSKAGYRSMCSDRYGDAPEVNKNAEDRASFVYRSFEGTVKIDL